MSAATAAADAAGVALRHALELLPPDGTARRRQARTVVGALALDAAAGRAGSSSSAVARRVRLPAALTAALLVHLSRDGITTRDTWGRWTLAGAP